MDGCEIVRSNAEFAIGERISWEKSQEEKDGELDKDIIKTQAKLIDALQLELKLMREYPVSNRE